MYIGSRRKETRLQWVANPDNPTMQYQVSGTIIPGLANIIDEMLINVADSYHRTRGTDRPTTLLDFSVHPNTGEISISNNGRCIDVEFHKAAQKYCPELVFGTFQTGSNFDDSEARVTGGRNGVGATVVNTLSKYFDVDIGDSVRGLRYRQKWVDSMTTLSEPVIEEYAGSEYTKVVFLPMYHFFGLEGLDDIHLQLFARRAGDLAACCPGLEVIFNGKKVPLTGFEQYALNRIPVEESEEEDVVPAGKCAAFTVLHDKQNNLPWHIGVTPRVCDNVSFVNAIHTAKGGTHVKVVQAAVVEAIRLYLTATYKFKVHPNTIKENITIFLNCLVIKPEFDSQTKDQLTFPSERKLAGALPSLPSKFLDAICKTEAIINPIVEVLSRRSDKNFAKHTKTRVAVAKLEDARHAGSATSLYCTLLLTEGDSAKSLAMAGLSELGRQWWGVFPLKGKLLNTMKQGMQQNEVLHDLQRVIGLNVNKTYATAEERATLRYGSIAILCDQDPDGSHIKGLIVAWFRTYWPELLKQPMFLPRPASNYKHSLPQWYNADSSSTMFLKQIATPLVKAFPKSAKPKNDEQERWFYSMQEFNAWQEEEAQEASSYVFRYYKGLGSSTSKEGREYFKQLFSGGVSRPTYIPFTPMTPVDEHAVETAFGACTERRRRWLNSIDGSPLDTSTGEVSINEFVNTDVASYFHYINLERALPSCIDGLKPSQRKVLHTCFHRDLSGHKEMKVAQLAGAVAELTCYHHGDMSMHETIVKLAQDFVGSGNNVPLLEPLGQFGTRLAGGSDHASARYISTRLSPLVRFLFPEEDDALLERRTEEGRTVEPVTFVPIIPMVLVNGAHGIGSGYSCKISSHDPLAVAGLLFELLDSEKKMLSVQKAGSRREKMDDQCAAVETQLFGVHILMAKLHKEEALSAWDKERRTLAAGASTQNLKADKAKASTAKTNGKAKNGKAKTSQARKVDAATIARRKEKFLTQFFRKKAEAHPEGVRLAAKLASIKESVRVRRPTPWSHGHPAALTPWYHGHKVGSCPDQVSAGIFREVADHTDVIEELPVGVWTDTFIEFLEVLLTTKKIRGYTSDCTEKTVNFSIRYNSDETRTLVRSKLKKLDRNNPTMIDPAQRSTLKVHTDLLHVVTNIYMPKRLALYEARRTSQQTSLQENLDEQNSVLELLNFLRDAHTNNQLISLDTMRQAGIADPLALSRKVSSAELLLANDGSVTRRTKTVKRLQKKINDVVRVSARQMWQQELVAFAHAYVAHFKSCPDDVAKRLAAYPQFKSLTLKVTSLELPSELPSEEDETDESHLC